MLAPDDPNSPGDPTPIREHSRREQRLVHKTLSTHIVEIQHPDNMSPKCVKHYRLSWPAVRIRAYDTNTCKIYGSNSMGEWGEGYRSRTVNHE